MTHRLLQLIEESRVLRPRTKKIYSDATQRFLRDTNAELTPSGVNRWLSQLVSQGISTRTVNLYRAAIRWASKRASEVDGTLHFARPVEGFRQGQVQRAPRSLTPEEVLALLQVVDSDSWIDTRDRVILLLGIRVGLRRHEIAKAKWGDIVPPNRLIVVGKGGRRDEVTLDEPTCEALRSWRRLSQGSVHRPDDPIVRPLQPRLGTWPGLTPEGIYHVVKQRALQAGITDMGVHTLRHTFVSLALRGKADPWRVSQAARHRSINTTLGTYAHDLQANEGEPVGSVLDTVLQGVDHNGDR